MLPVCNTINRLGAVIAAALIASPTLGAASAPTPAEIASARDAARSLSIAFESAAQAVAPSVVNVKSVARVEMHRRTQFGSLPDALRGSPFEEFFGDDFFRRFNTPSPSEGLIRQGQGSGFIVSEDGYILTNNHVVDGATKVSVQLPDDREFDAEIVGTDPSTDLALLKIDAHSLTPVKFGDSDDLRVGEWVVAVGNPFGLDSTITAGIVSATGRSRVGLADYEDYIQTDAAINPGNSGGPLVNLQGEVVGINTAIATRTGGNMGVGFAIPSNMAEPIFASLRENGTVTRGWLGVVIQDLDEGLAQSFGYEGTEGVLVSQVQDDSPADGAGLKVGDIIVGFDGRAVRDSHELRLGVASTPPDTKVELRVFRDGKQVPIRVTIGTLDQDSVASAASGAVTDEWGMRLRTLDDELAEQFALDTDEGVVVMSVDPFGPAARAGLRTRDVITHVGDTRVRNLKEFRKAMKKHDADEGVRFTVRSGDVQRFVFFRMQESPAN